ncbi:probable disease resistance protein At4g27220 [Quercus suber]|uniref:probable disease resistance protein At4g27220 n=1 Tax=Quercus suber TaxID=58331 RepID=UPI0032E031F2
MEFLTETVKVFVEKTVGYTIAVVGRQMGYLIRYKKNVDNLNNKVDDLKDARDSVQRKVQAASYNVEEIEANVQRWQTRVQGITAEVEEFVEKEGQAKFMCFNLKARYQIGKKAHKMGLDVKELKDEADTFHTVGHRVPIEGGTTISTKGYEDFESRKSIFDGVMKALKDDNILAIGVCGMGGLGKTMLVGKIATQAMEDKLFERIVTVVVSQTPNLKQIQKEIAKELVLKFEDEDTDFQKAHLLCERLKKEKILLIVDDIWNKIDLDALGISFGDNSKGSKLLLTSRFRDVLDKDMDAEKIFHVDILSNEEAIFLFVKIVGDFAETLNFQSTMVGVVEECAGLPIAITTVANTLKNQKNPNVWKDALQQLKRANPTQIKGMHEKVYTSIKFSYNFLSKEAQSLFLFCSSFEEDMDIQIDLLWRYLVGLDFFEDIYKMEEVRNRVHTLVEILKDSCLLLEGYRRGTFKMHDVIRDVAIHIADKEKKMLTIRSSDDSEKWSNMKKMKDSIGIALFEAKFSELPQRLECPQLNFIILGDEENSLQIPNHIFEGAKNLKVLVLMGPSLPLPSSLSLLQTLQTLALLECESESEDLALIGELKNLKALVLVDSKIKQLPTGIRQLTHLQLLDLRRCTELEAIPSNVLSSLKNLEEIHMNRSFNQWQVGGEITERSNARVSKLDHLLHLTTLCIHIPNPNILPNALLFDKLVRYEILIGPNWDWDYHSRVEFEISRTLKIDLDRSFQEEDGVKILLKGCEYLTLALGKGIKNILYEVDKEGFPRLKHLYVQNSVEIQYIIDSIWFQCVAFPVLELLSLVNMINLEKICHNQLAMGSFRSLRKLEIRKCDNLVFVFSSTLLRCFSQLQEIEIEDCKVMSAIVVEERKHGIQVNDDIITDTIDFPQLRSLNLKRLPNLMGFCSNVDSQPLFNKKVAFSNLENLHIDAIYKLKMLWHNQLDADSFCKLKQLRVDDCENLINIFQPNILRRLQNLEDLQIRNCNLVEEVFEVQGKNGDEICDMVVSTQFKVLKLINLPNLKHVWSLGAQAILTFQSLHEVEVSNCKSMKSLFPASVAKSLKQLKKLKIHDCGLEEIVAMEEGLETMTKFVFPQLVSLSLELMPDLKCFYPGKHTIEWPSLKQLMILKCDKVKIVALNELSFPNTDGLGHDVPIQQPFFFQIEKVAFPNLEYIHISDMDNLKMLWHNHQLAPDSFCKLKKLFVRGCKNLINIFPPNMLRRLQNLEELGIGNCISVEEVFEIRGANVDEICDTVSTQLRVLRLSYLPKLKHVWSLDLQAILTFQNLHTVEVFNCNILKSLFPISVAKSLKQLERLTIHNCGLEEIVALKEGVETTIKFVFPRITSLYLESLPELKHFYPGKHTLEWPSLKRMRIKNCDKVKIIASNELSFQERDELGHHVQIQQPLFPIEKDTLSNFEELKLNWDDAIYQTYDRLKAQFCCKLKVLGLYSKDRSTEFPWVFVQGLYNLKELDIANFFLEEICPCGIVDNEGQYAEMFERLTTLHLSKMPKLMHLWKENSQQGIRGIQNLESLHVSYCGRLKNIVPSSMCFRNLYTLEVSECHGLISLATSSTVKSLSNSKD